ETVTGRPGAASRAAPARPLGARQKNAPAFPKKLDGTLDRDYYEEWWGGIRDRSFFSPTLAVRKIAIESFIRLVPFRFGRSSHGPLLSRHREAPAQGLHADRALGGDSDHRHPDRAVAAGGAEGA